MQGFTVLHDDATHRSWHDVLSVWQTLSDGLTRGTALLTKIKKKKTSLYKLLYFFYFFARFATFNDNNVNYHGESNTINVQK